MDIHSKAVPLAVVLEAERTEIDGIRARRGIPGFPFNSGKPRKPEAAPPVPGTADKPEWQRRDKDWVEVIKKAHAANLVGLAFSGGGIRSATFNLGVLQALADLKLLYRIDYLSTVSGGGYIGGWLAAWIKREEKGFAEVQKQLAPNRIDQVDDKEPTPIRFLRVFSNYLTPKLGIFSGDTLATVGIVLRNMLLNQVVVLALLTAVLLIPRAVERSALTIQFTPDLSTVWMWVAIILLLVAFFTILNNMAYMDLGRTGGARQLTKQGWVLTLAACPLFATAALGAIWQMARFQLGQKNLFGYSTASWLGAETYGGIWFAATLLGIACRKWLAAPTARFADEVAELKGENVKPPSNSQKAPDATMPSTAERKEPFRRFVEFLITWVAAIAAGALAGLLYATMSEQMSRRVSDALVYGVPLVVGIFLLAGGLHIGLMGTIFADRRREWWGRLSGWLLVWSLTWLAIFWVALYFPHFIENNQLLHKAAAKYLTPAWIVTTLGGVLAGRSKASGKPGTLTWKDVIAKIAPYVFAVGLVCWLSWGIDRIQAQNLLNAYPWIVSHRLWILIVGCAVMSIVLAWRVDVNQFSLHMLYRNRLVRAYLGASNSSRSPNRFTGFDRNDDLHLKDFSVEEDHSYNGPYPILNASLNLVKGQDLAWQERKAESFVMTPRYCGYDVWLEDQDSPILRGERPQTLEEVNRREQEETKSWLRRWLRRRDRYGYRPTEDYAFPSPFHGPDLGLAMGISGAAASPNMGFYTSTPVAFLMTIFNVRLGQWLGNPRNRRTYKRASPLLGLSYLINELLAGTDDKASYVYLSDGGHFENLAIYELVKRRCGLIIVCDAEADSEYGFGGLGNAIRKCRVDLGIDIVLDIADIKPKKEGEHSKRHYAFGTIHYENVDLSAPTGTIIYFKASLTGDEPTDVKNYSKMHATFPHESTVDQWFSGSQFESYRALGYHEVTSSIPNLIRPIGSEAKPPGPGPESTAVSSQPPKNRVWAAVENAAVELASAAASTLRAGADAISPLPSASRRDKAKEEERLTDMRWKKKFNQFGFDTSRLKPGSASG